MQMGAGPDGCFPPSEHHFSIRLPAALRFVNNLNNEIDSFIISFPSLCKWQQTTFPAREKSDIPKSSQKSQNFDVILALKEKIV